ncbi:rRNA maturation RNase YbeY [Jiulongibacter sp. NS-SX5]|uniref:rRNA maturation RNase YbeY n=1 Tax=Jiulongibacter sp. NS-SX5 TaxID=3463854 RepID=UPI0040582328
MISFQSEGIEFDLQEESRISDWLVQVAKIEGFQIEELNYIFLSDEGLYEINMEYLNHDTYTDIITFDNSDDEEIIEGDIFISIERVKENAETFETEFETELRRVLAHGVLHLCGYKDKSDEDTKLMREMEEKSLGLY